MLFDATKSKCILEYKQHKGRVGCISFCTNNLLSTGGNDKNVLTVDIRSSRQVYHLSNHSSEITALRWSPDEQ